jgi:hypothetical protein
MSATTVKITTQRTNSWDGENAVLNLTFSNRDKAWSFYCKALGRPGVVNVSIGSTFKTYGNVDTALAELDTFIGSNFASGTAI